MLQLLAVPNLASRTLDLIQPIYTLSTRGLITQTPTWSSDVEQWPLPWEYPNIGPSKLRDASPSFVSSQRRFGFLWAMQTAVGFVCLVVSDGVADGLPELFVMWAFQEHQDEYTLQYFHNIGILLSRVFFVMPVLLGGAFEPLVQLVPGNPAMMGTTYWPCVSYVG